MIRHRFAPPVNGCRFCGYLERGHARVFGAGRWHRWIAPTDAQRKARLLAHIAARRAEAA